MFTYASLNKDLVNARYTQKPKMMVSKLTLMQVSMLYKRFFFCKKFHLTR